MPKLLSQKKKKKFTCLTFIALSFISQDTLPKNHKKKKKKKKVCVYIYIYIYETPMLQKKIKKISQYMHVY